MQTEVVRNLVFARLTKIDEANRLVYGRAVQEVPDRVGEIFDYTTSKPFFGKWSTSQSEASMGKSDGNIRVMHTEKVAGKIPPGGMVFNDDEGAIDICAKITDENEFAKCLDGSYTGFSIGGKYEKRWDDVDLKKVRYTANPSEISLVDRPCVTTATFFDIQKADGTILHKDFKPVAELVKIVRNDGAQCAHQLEKSKLPDVGDEFDADGVSYQVTKIEGGVVYVDEVFNIIGTAAELGIFAKAAAGKNLTIADVTKLIEKAEPNPAQITPEAIAAKADELIKAASGDPVAVKKDAPKYAQFTAAAEKELRKVAARADADPEAGKAKYGAVKFADEKNKKYPLDTAAHVHAALSYWGMAKNRAKYSEDDQKAITGKIHAAAKEKGIEVTEKVMTAKDIRKGLVQCAQLAYVIDGLCNVCDSVEMETAREGDNSPICAKLYNCVDDLGSVLQEMVGEEISEEVTGADNGAHTALMALSEKVSGLRKKLDALSGVSPEAVVAKSIELAKAAGHADVSTMTQEDAKKFGDLAYAELRKKSPAQAMHDKAVADGAKCAMAAADQTGNLAKMLTEKATAMLKSQGITAPTDDQLKKAVELLAPADPLAKIALENADLRKTIKDMDERVKRMEKQPLPARVTLRAIAKGDDATGAGNLADRLVAEVPPVLKADGTVDEVATATKMVLHMGGTKVRMSKQRS